LTHSDICKQVIIDFAKKQWRMYTVDNGYAYRKDGHMFKYGTEEGFPDDFGHTNKGQTVYVECKTINDSIRPKQKAFLDRAKRNGCLCYIARENVMGDGYELTEWS